LPSTLLIILKRAHFIDFKERYPVSLLSCGIFSTRTNFSYSYVGTLIEINSEDSTVALENVTSFGTEGRRDNIADEVAPSDSVYEYIVFRGSDVKDLRIEEPPKENEPPKPPQVPNDPAILGVSGTCLFVHSNYPRPTDEIYSDVNHCHVRERKLVWIFSVAFLLMDLNMSITLLCKIV